MPVLFSTRWWAISLRGLLAATFGVFVLLSPEIDRPALALLFGGFALLEGFFNLVSAFEAPPGRRAPTLILEGLASVVAGFLALTVLGRDAGRLAWTIGTWALVTGVCELVAAVRLRRQIAGEWRMTVAGLLSLALGGLLLLSPRHDALAVAPWIGIGVLAIGAVRVALAFRVRSWDRGSSQDMPPGGITTSL